MTTTITFETGESGESEVLVPVDTIDDAIAELQESFEAILSDPTGGLMIGAQSIATINILDDEGDTIYPVANLLHRIATID